MFWQEDNSKDDVSSSDKVVDLSYKIDCRLIPNSHAWELAQALYEVLPWLQDEPEAGIHQIHGAASGNGWQRPPDGELIHLSKRTRMHLRVPVSRVDDASALSGKSLDIMGHQIDIGQMSVKTIGPLSTLFSRYIVLPEGSSEDDFLHWVNTQLKARHIAARKLLCGMGHEFEADGQLIETRSLMIADLDKAASIALQEAGIGPHRHLGCGLFVPHKGIKAVGESEDKTNYTGA